MRLLKITLITVAGLLLTGILLLAVLLLYLHNSDLASPVSKLVNTWSEHELVIDGALSLDVSLSPRVRVGRVRFKGADAGVEVEADAMHLQVDLLELLDGKLQILDISAHDMTVVVRLAYDESADTQLPAYDIRAATVDRVDISNLAVDVYQWHEIEPLRFRLDSMQAERNEIGVLAPITARGSVDGEPFRLDGSVARGEADTAAGRSYIVDARFEVMQSYIQASGELAGANGGSAAGPGGELAVQLDIPDVQAVLHLFHFETPPLGALSATGRLAGTPDALELSNLDARLVKEGVNVKTTGSVANLGVGTGLDLKYEVDITDAGLLAWLLPEEVPQFNSVQSGWTISGDVDRLVLVAERLLAADGRGHSLDLSGKVTVKDSEPFLDDLQTKVKLSAPDLAYVRQFSDAVPRLGPVNARASISMQDGVLAIRDIEASSRVGSEGRVTASGAIGQIGFAPVSVSGMDFSARIEDVTSQQVGEALGLELPLISPVNATGTYRGSDRQSVVGNLQVKAGRRGKLWAEASGDVRLGDFSSAQPLTGLQLQVAAQSTNTRELAALVGAEMPSLGFLKADGKVKLENGLLGLSDLEASIERGDEFNLQVSGAVEDMLEITGVAVRVDARAADLHALGEPFEIELPQEGSVHLAGNIRGNRERLRLNGRTNLRNSTIAMELNGYFTGERPRIAGTIETPSLDVNDLGFHPERYVAEKESEAVSDDFYTDTASDYNPDDTVPLFSTQTIRTAWMKVMDLDITATVGALRSTEATVGDIYTHLVLDNARLEAKPLRYSMDGNTLTLAFVINARESVPTASLMLNGNDIDLGLLLRTSPDQQPPARGTMSAAADLHSRGATRAEMAANLTGDIKVIMENGRVRKGLMNLLKLDVLGWVLANTISLEQDMNVGCAIFSMGFDQGKGDTDLFIIDTPTVLVRIDAHVNFNDETMYIAILPERKRRLLRSRDPMEIQGPITNPQYRLVSLRDLTVETSQAVLLAPLTITGTLLGNLATIVGATPEPEGTCDQFISQ